jgi:hypothetical protein
MTIYRGLNLFKTLNDADDKRVALINLGLNQKDLNLIKGLSTIPVSKNDMHFIGGLREDQAKSMYSLGSSSTAVNILLGDLKDIAQPLEHNLNINGQFLTAGVKFKYVNYDKLYENSLTSGDVSTSRVSAWSLLGSTLVYGGDVVVTGDTLRVGSLATEVAPIPKTFRSEIPTHTITMKVKSGKEGTLAEHKFIAMKGIPLTFTANFRNAVIGHVVDQGVVDNYNLGTDDQTASENKNVPATWRITNDDGGSYNSGDGTVANPGNLANGFVQGQKYKFAFYLFPDSSSKRRKVEFFYDPTKTRGLSLNSINLNSWPKAVVSGLKRLEVVNNDFFQLPSFGAFGVPVDQDDDDAETVSSANSDESFVKGFQYTITSITGTTAAQWHNIAGTTLGTDPNYVVGDSFTAVDNVPAIGTAIITALDTRLTTKQISVGNFIVGEVYEIITLGDTSSDEWNTAAGTTGVTYIARDDTTDPKTQGSIFTAETAGATAGTTDGTAIVSKHGILPLSGFLPNLEELDISINNLSRASHADGRQIVATHQLNTLPLSLKRLKLTYTFRDSTEIDLLNYRNLTHFEFDDQIGDERKQYRTMPTVSNTHVTPKVSTNIEDYYIRGHRYALLASGLCASKTLKKLEFRDIDLYGQEGEVVSAGNFIPGTRYRITDTGDMNQAAWQAVGETPTPSSTYANGTTFIAKDPQPASVTGTGKAIVSENITIASTELTKFCSHSNKHGVVSAAGKTNLTFYQHTSSEMDLVPDVFRAVAPGTFTDCTQINYLHLGYSNLLTGDADQIVRNMPKLKFFHIIRNSMTVNLTDETFYDGCVLDRLYIGNSFYQQNGAGAFGDADPNAPADNPTLGLQVFYRTPSLRILYVHNSSVLTGALPDFSTNKLLQRVHFASTSMSGMISINQLAPSGEFLQLLEIFNNNFTQMDNFFTNEKNIFDRLRKILLQGNNIDYTIISDQSIKGCPSVEVFNISNNRFKGDVPNFSGSPNLQECTLANNDITGYDAGSLANNLQLNVLDISNNNLSVSAGQALLTDLYFNYISAKRSGVYIDISGNGNITLQSLVGNNSSLQRSLRVLKAANWIFKV